MKYQKIHDRRFNKFEQELKSQRAIYDLKYKNNETRI